MSRHRVFLIQEAEEDLLEIYRYVARFDSTRKAEALLQQLEALCRSLEILPGRGNHPRELRRLGVTRFREVHRKPYRVIYELAANQVFVHAVLDGRRDLDDLLQRRLLR